MSTPTPPPTPTPTIDPQDILVRIPKPVLEICRALHAKGFAAHVVGGAIRDLLLDRSSEDFDVATSARPDEITAVFGRRRTIPTGEKHGTMTVLTSELAQGVEVTTFRGEGAYSDGRRPDSVEFVSDLTEDLRRRDFTINALAFDPATLTIADPFEGVADLQARVIRAVGNATERFGEDGLRIMRAVRLAAQLEFTLEADTLSAIPGAIPVFRKVSVERIRDELLKLLSAPHPSVGLRLMQETNLLREVLPELMESIGVAQNRFHAYDVFDHTLHTVDETNGDAILRLGALLHDVAKPRTAAQRDDAPGEYTFYRHEHVGADLSDRICRRLKLANRDRERVVAIVGHHMFWYTPEWTDATVRRFIGRVGVDRLPDLFALREGDVRARGRGEDPATEIDELRGRIAIELEAERALKVADLAIDGGDVMRILSCAPGRLVGDVLRALLERVIDDPTLNTKELLEGLVPDIAQTLRR